MQVVQSYRQRTNRGSDKKNAEEKWMGSSVKVNDEGELQLQHVWTAEKQEDQKWAIDVSRMDIVKEKVRDDTETLQQIIQA